MMMLALLMVAWAANAPLQSKEVAVRNGSEAVVRMQARIEDRYLIVRATHGKGWHTYAMDNELRALTALKGKMSLGIEKGIEIKVDGGLELEGDWSQTKPIDLSKPELRWYTYGFEQTALFACRVKTVSSDEVRVRVRGQACSGETCCNVDITLELEPVPDPVTSQGETNRLPVKATLAKLVPVKTQNDPTPQQP